MKPDEAIDLVREWRRYNYAEQVPSPVVIAETDWLSYVQAMASTLPDEDLAYPTEEDVLWDWPEGVVIVFAEPLEVQHTIVSSAQGGGQARSVPAHTEVQHAAALCIMKKQSIPTRVQGPKIQGTVPMEPMFAYPTLWISTDPTDIVQGHWLPGMQMRPPGLDAEGPNVVSGSTILLVSIITALGHRLTWLAEPRGTRHERRRAERVLPGLRVLELASGATVQARNETGSSVHWTRRWMVRGHWRLQPHGPGRSLRKPIWIDPYVKGPEGKPLDVRTTVWRRR